MIILRECYAQYCRADAEAYWLVEHKSGRQRRYLRCRKHRLEGLQMVDMWTGLCPHCLDGHDKSYCRSHLCRNYSPQYVMPTCPSMRRYQFTISTSDGLPKHVLDNIMRMMNYYVSDSVPFESKFTVEGRVL